MFRFWRFRESSDLRVVGRSFFAVVPARIVAFAVVVVLAVLLVVFLVVGYEILEG